MSVIGYFILLAFIFAIAIFMCVLSISWLIASSHGAPYVPTRHNVVLHILDHAHLQKGQIFLELGCGDARIVRTAVKKYGVHGIGLDVTWLFLTLGRLKAWIQGIRDIKLVRENVFTTEEIKKADVIYIFLMPQMITKLLPKLEQDMKKDVLVISHGFVIPQWKNNLVDSIENKPFSTFYYRPLAQKLPNKDHA